MQKFEISRQKRNVSRTGINKSCQSRFFLAEKFPTLCKVVSSLRKVDSFSQLKHLYRAKTFFIGADWAIYARLTKFLSKSGRF
ncbi:MAG: hypothetical protein SFV22_15545 [Saprospiraceae bacterium]|nr:hypothetical protein [Saprospiraceae bacterium]